MQRVTLDDVVWSGVPDRYEAGSPNVIGAVALGAACDVLAGYGMDVLAAEERPLVARLRAGLRAIPGVLLLDAWADERVDRVGVSTFTVDGRDHRLVAAALAAEHAISVRSGAFCAHPLVGHLLGLSPDLTTADVPADRPSGAVRVSIGLGVGDGRDRRVPGRRALDRRRRTERAVRARRRDAAARTARRHPALARSRRPALGRAAGQRRALPLSRI